MVYNKKESENRNGYTSDMQKAKARSFMIGDKVEVQSGEGVTEVAVIERFFPHLVLYRRENGTTFTLRYSDAAQARLVKQAKFQIHSERMDQEAVLKSLGNRKIGEKNG